MAKITGIGGVFLKTNMDPQELSAWYQKHLGMPLEAWGGAKLKWPEDAPEVRGRATAWKLAGKDSNMFSPSTSSFMINYRVDNMVEMISQLKADGIEILKGPESHENGKFASIMDPDGNRVELWEPMIWDDKNKDA